MRNTRAALRYAKAALSISLEQNKEEVLAQDMEHIVSVFAENKALGQLLENPVITNSVKQDSLQQVFTSLSSISSKVIALLVTNNRIDLLDQVALAYLDLLKNTKERKQQ
jgi:F-type H+-transporting ATPase subunit delta